MAEKFKSFYIDHISRQQNAHADALALLVALITLPAKVTKKVFIASCGLYCPKFALEDNGGAKDDYQFKEVLETLMGP